MKRSLEKSPRVIRHKNILIIISILLSTTILLMLVGETFVRLKGVQPWRKFDMPIKVDPGGKFFSKHPTLGYSHIPGEFTVTLQDGYLFKVTHLPNTLRITHPLSTYKKFNQKDEIWIFGCSFTHGWSLNDQETFPWLVQDRFSQYEVSNFGVSGYGPLHSLIQLREALTMGRIPKLIVVTYASFHDSRNVFLRSWRKAIVPFNKLGPLVQPYARIDSNGKLSIHLSENIDYREFFLMRHSALIHFIEILYNKFEEQIYDSRDVSKAVILEIANVAKNNNISLVLAGMVDDKNTRDMLLFAHKKGIGYIDMAIDLTIKENTNLPHDGHPSAIANNKYADKLEIFLMTNLLHK
jgi:hypothetical protein